MPLHPEQADEHDIPRRRHPQRSVPQPVLQMHLTMSRSDSGAGPKSELTGFTLSSESSRHQSSAVNVFPCQCCHCCTWWNTLMLWYFVTAEVGGNMFGWMAFFRVVTSSWKRWYLMVSRWSFSFPFSTLVVAFSPAAITWCFDEFTLLNTSRKVSFSLTSFNPAAFPIPNSLDVVSHPSKACTKRIFPQMFSPSLFLIALTPIHLKAPPFFGSGRK